MFQISTLMNQKMQPIRHIRLQAMLRKHQNLRNESDIILSDLDDDDDSLDDSDEDFQL